MLSLEQKIRDSRDKYNVRTHKCCVLLIYVSDRPIRKFCLSANADNRPIILVDYRHLPINGRYTDMKPIKA